MDFETSASYPQLDQEKLNLLFAKPDSVLQRAGFGKSPDKRTPGCFVDKCGGQDDAVAQLGLFLSELDVSDVPLARNALLQYLCIENDGSDIFGQPSRNGQTSQSSEINTMSEYLTTEFEFRNKKYPFHILSGIVVDTDTRSDTHVFGGGHTQMGNGSSYVGSSVSVTKDIWIKDINGREHRFQFGDIAVRAGHIVHIGQLDNGQWLVLKNEATNSTHWPVITFSDLNKKRGGASFFWLVCVVAAFVAGAVWAGIAYQPHDYLYSTLDYATRSDNTRQALFLKGAGLWFAFSFVIFLLMGSRNESPQFIQTAVDKLKSLSDQLDERSKQLQQASEPVTAAIGG